MRHFQIPRPSLVMTMATLLVALSGTGYAASHARSGGRAAAAKSKLQRGPRGPRGPRGVRGLRGLMGTPGPQGPAGAAGISGSNGANGSPAFGAMVGRGTNVPMGTQFLAPSGQGRTSTDENDVTSITPDAPVKASDLAI